MVNVIRVLQRIISNICMCIRSMFWHRRRDIVLFGSWFGQKFADNTRYLYQYLAEHKKELGLSHVVWVTRKQSIYNELSEIGYEVYMMDSDEALFLYKKAGIHFICNAGFDSYDGSVKGDIMGEYSWGAKRVNLWHGVGVIKRVGYASNSYKTALGSLYCLRKLLNGFKWYRKLVSAKGGWGDCYYLSPTATTTKQFKDMLWLPDDNFISTCCPRICDCPKLLTSEITVIEKIKQYTQVILYLPTFRRDNSKFSADELSGFLEPLLIEYNILLLQKSHSADSRLMTENGNQDCIMTLPDYFDINVIFPYINIVITDYSSAVSDARFWGKPVLLYMPDYQDYMSGSNGLTEEAEELMGEAKFYDLPSLKIGIPKCIENPERMKSTSYKRISEKYWGETKSLQQIWEDIIQWIKV